MERLDKIFFLLALLIVLLVVCTAFKESRPSWVRYQEDYRRELVTRSGASRGAAMGIPLGIHQDWLQEFNRVDRCRTCHISINDPAFKDAPQPLTTHPQIHHMDFEAFGCTVCHNGQGRALNVEDAHGYAENWDYPILPPGFAQGKCGTCHLGRKVPEAPNLTRGRYLIERYQCASCHELGDFEPQIRHALDISGIGSKVGSGWLKAWLLRPVDYLPLTKMPNFHFTEREAEAIGAYLISSKDTMIEGLHLDPLSEEEEIRLIALGKKRFSQARCVSCHQVEGKGGTIGPDLGGISDKVAKEWLYLWLSNPKKLLLYTEMPSFSFPKEEIRALVEFIMAEFSLGNEYEPVEEMEKPSPDLIQEGRELVKKYGCYACHILPDDIVGGVVGPDLSEIATKPVSQIDFGRTAIEESLPNYLFVKLQAPRAFGKDLKMPDFELSVDDAAMITMALLGQARRGIKEKYFQKEIRRGEEFRPQGEIGRLIAEFECFSCHKIFGRGGTLAPELTYIGSQLQTPYLENFLINPDTIRPFLVERMPKLGLSKQQAGLFSDYAKMVLTTDVIPEMEISDSPEVIEAGRKLYYERYKCDACHLLDGKGGYYGPVLDKAGNRLKPGWIYARLLNPRILDSNAREPNLGISKMEALDLTAFIASRKPAPKKGKKP